MTEGKKLFIGRYVYPLAVALTLFLAGGIYSIRLSRWHKSNAYSWPLEMFLVFPGQCSGGQRGETGLYSEPSRIQPKSKGLTGTYGNCRFWDFGDKCLS